MHCVQFVGNSIWLKYAYQCGTVYWNDEVKNECELVQVVLAFYFWRGKSLPFLWMFSPTPAFNCNYSMHCTAWALRSPAWGKHCKFKVTSTSHTSTSSRLVCCSSTEVSDFLNVAIKATHELNILHTHCFHCYRHIMLPALQRLNVTILTVHSSISLCLST